jgi:hypothetical protein
VEPQVQGHSTSCIMDTDSYYFAQTHTDECTKHSYSLHIPQYTTFKDNHYVYAEIRTWSLLREREREREREGERLSLLSL